MSKIPAVAYRILVINGTWMQTLTLDRRRTHHRVSGAGSHVRRYGATKADDLQFARLVGASLIVRVKP